LSGPLLVGISESVRAVQAQPPQAASHPAPQKKAPETAPITTPPGPQATTKPQLIIKGSDFVGNGTVIRTERDLDINIDTSRFRDNKTIIDQRAQTFEAQKAALALVTDTADRIRNIVNTSGFDQQVKLSGEIKAAAERFD
jgi:hypothetical protein